MGWAENFANNFAQQAEKVVKEAQRVSNGAQQPAPMAPTGWCPPPDCYQNCALQDKERRKACVLINKAHAEKMKAIGCPTSCTTKAVGKTCRKKKNPKKCPKKKGKKKKC